METSDQVLVARAVKVGTPSGLAEMSSLEFEDIRYFLIEEAEHAKAAQRAAERQQWLAMQKGG